MNTAILLRNNDKVDNQLICADDLSLDMCRRLEEQLNDKDSISSEIFQDMM